MRTCDPAVDQHRHKQQVLAPTHHLELQSPPARAAAWRASKVQVRGWSDGSFTGIPLRRAGFARPMCFLTGRSYSDPMYDIFLNLTQPRPLHNDANGPKVITSHTRWSVGQQALFWKFNRMLNLLICPRNWQNWYSRCRESIIWPGGSDDCFLLRPLMCNMWLWIKSVILSSPLPSHLTRYTTSHSTYLWNGSKFAQCHCCTRRKTKRKTIPEYVWRKQIDLICVILSEKSQIRLFSPRQAHVNTVHAPLSVSWDIKEHKLASMI